MKNIAVQISGKLIEEARLFAKIEDRSVAKQIEHWIKLGKCAEENPDLPLEVIKEILMGIEQLNQGQGIPYKFED